MIDKNNQRRKIRCICCGNMFVPKKVGKYIYCPSCEQREIENDSQKIRNAHAGLFEALWEGVVIQAAKDYGDADERGRAEIERWFNSQQYEDCNIAGLDKDYLIKCMQDSEVKNFGRMADRHGM